MPMDVPVPQAVADHWEDLIADCEATAEDYREEGWETLVIHTGDATPLADEPWGVDVLAPDNEFEALQDLVAGADFVQSHVLRAEAGGVRFFGIVVEAPAAERVVVVPAYVVLESDYVEDLEERVREEGEMRTLVRPLTDDKRVTFSHADPDLFF